MINVPGRRVNFATRGYYFMVGERICLGTKGFYFDSGVPSNGWTSEFRVDAVAGTAIAVINSSGQQTLEEVVNDKVRPILTLAPGSLDNMTQRGFESSPLEVYQSK